MQPDIRYAAGPNLGDHQWGWSRVMAVKSGEVLCIRRLASDLPKSVKPGRTSGAPVAILGGTVRSMPMQRSSPKSRAIPILREDRHLSSIILPILV